MLVLSDFINLNRNKKEINMKQKLEEIKKLFETEIKQKIASS